jgi:quinoprotein glucose dehydrogenase
VPIVLALLFFAAQTGDGDWPAYGRDSGGTKFSPLTQINRENVAKLKPAWTFRTAEVFDPKKVRKEPAHEATPLFIGETLYLSTPFGQVIALDPEQGTRRWTYDAKVDLQGNYGDFASRGVSTWVDPVRKATDPCRRRIFVAPIDARLIALDAATGKACADFGDNGQIDLLTGLKRGPAWKGEYQETSPPAILNGLVIVGSSIADNSRVDAPTGEVRAFDARTGKLRWTWHPLADTTHAGAANAWSLISTDAERNLVFIPTGSPSPDYYAGLRKGDDRSANSVVALRGDTGTVVWSFQTVHHDLWDYDVPAQPVLFLSGKRAAVAVGSKTGNLFLLDRETGKPLFGVEERPVPRSDVPGEEASRTQPFPVLPKPVAPQTFEVWGANDADRKWCEEQVRGLRNDGIFTPPSLQGSLVFPGNIGGIAWGGEAFDPVHGLLIVPTNRFAAAVRLIPQSSFKAEIKAHPGRETTEQKGAPYAMSRQFLMTPGHVPCNAPPWGALTAIDAATGERRWEAPLGSVGLGGPIVTAGGLIFFAATIDPHLRAFDVMTGKELWTGDLPASARATPMTYRTRSGKQFVVVSAGGIKDLTALGDYVVAFALP